MVGSYSWEGGRKRSAWRPLKLLLGPAKPPNLAPGSRPCTGQALSVLCDLSGLNVPLGHYKEEEVTSTGTRVGPDPGRSRGPLLLTNTRRCRAQTSPTAPFCSGPHTTSTVLCFRERAGKGNTCRGHSKDKGMALGILLCSGWETEAQVGEGTGLGFEGNRIGQKEGSSG